MLLAGRKFYGSLTVIYLFVDLLVQGLQLPDVYWHPREPIFNSSLCTHEDSRTIWVHEYDSLNIICCNRDLNNAVLGAGMVSGSDKNMHNYNIIVTEDKELFEERKQGPKAKIIHNCRQKYTDSNAYGNYQAAVDKCHVPFSPFANPGKPTFEAGKTYYFYTTSNGSEASLKNDQGPDKTRHMAFTVKVCEKNCEEKRERINRCVKQRPGWPLPRTDDIKPEGSKMFLIIGVSVAALVLGFILGIFWDRRVMKKHFCTRNEKISSSSGKPVFNASVSVSSKSSSTSTANEEAGLLPSKPAFV